MARTVAIYPSGATSPSGYDAVYTSMSAMEGGEDGNSGSHHITCEIIESDGSWSGSPDTNAVIFDGWDCDYDGGRYLDVYTVGGAKPSADAFYDTTAYMLSVDSSSATFTIDNDFDLGNSFFAGVFTDVQIMHGSTAVSNGNMYLHVSSSVDYVKFNRCWIQQDAASLNIRGDDAPTNPYDFINCVIEGGTHGYNSGGSAVVYFVNCDFVNINDDAIESNGDDVYPINCALFYNVDDFKDAFPSGYPLSCASDEGAGEGTDGIDLTPGVQATDLAVTFEGPTTGDYRLTGTTTTADLINAGTNQTTESKVPSVDILGNARPTGSNDPGVGAFAYQAGGLSQDVAGSLPEMAGALSFIKTFSRNLSGSI